MRSVLNDNVALDVLTVVSPSCCGDEPKDQDRAVWHPATRVACVADGVNASAYSERAAQLVCDLSPVLFTGEPAERISTICSALIALRLESLQAEVNVNPNASAAMRSVLIEAARTRLEQSFQTTFVAACFTPTDKGLLVELNACGDAACFAFSPQGELLTTYPDFAGAQFERSGNGDAKDAMPFGPGDQLLVKIVGHVSDRPGFGEQLNIHPRNASNWLICEPRDHCGGPRGKSITAGESSHVTRKCELVVPRHLVGTSYDNSPGGYCRLPYSRLIKSVSDNPQVHSFGGKGTVTAVLPDHYPARWVHRQERFASDTHFLLCSDGLYEAFQGPDELWSWLLDNEQALSAPDTRDRVLHALHTQRDVTRGDDDISLVWVKPQSVAGPRGE